MRTAEPSAPHVMGLRKRLQNNYSCNMASVYNTSSESPGSCSSELPGLPIEYLAPESPRDTNLSAPYFPNFSFGDIEIKCTGEMRNFWPIYGPTLKSLCLRHCDISEKALSDCLQMCPLLETLHIQGSNSMFMSGNVLENVVHELRMPCLADIELRQINYMSDAIFNRFVTIAPNLSRLALGDCRISYHEAIYLRFYTKRNRQTINSEVLAGKVPLQVQKNVLTLQNILNILTLRADTLKSISFGNTQMDSHGLKKMCAVLSKASIKLETLDLAVCSQLQNGIGDVSESFSSSLKCLDLSNCRRLSTTSLAEIPKLTNLTKLNLSGCLELTDSTMRQFGCLIHLRSLNLSAIPRITGPAILQGLKPLHHLEHLYLNHMLQLDSDTEQNIVSEEKLKRIIEANLQPYEQQLIEENESALMGIANMK
ncbi:hypothetical protein B566_EDAN003995, partial [Ephemera danica]